MNLPKKALSLILSMALVFTCIFTVNLKGDVKTSEAATVVLLQGEASGSKEVKLTWNKIKGVTEYVLVTSKAGTGKDSSNTISKSKTSYTAKKWKKKEFAKGYCYSFVLKAYKGSNCIAKSKKIYVIIGNTSGKYSNATGIKASKTALALKVGDEKTVTANLTQYKNKKQKNAWGSITFTSNKESVATVTSKGNITAVGKGKATIYAIAPNGLYAPIDVTVTDKKYNVVFDANGGIGMMEGFKTDYSSSVNLTKNTFAFPGQTFLGWSKDDEANSATYKNGQKVSKLTGEDGGTVTLYAIWEPNEYELNFNAGKGMMATSIKKDTLLYGEKYGELPGAVRKGYTLEGWYANGQKVDENTVFTGSSNITLYANWTVANYTIRW